MKKVSQTAKKKAILTSSNSSHQTSRIKLNIRTNMKEFKKIDSSLIKDDPHVNNTKYTQEANVCEICLSGHSYIGNQLVRCLYCECFVHQKCYGSDLLYIGDSIKNWICIRCKVIERNFKENMDTSLILNSSCCYFCPMKSGATKKVTPSFWAHIVCVNWIDGIEFENELKESARLISVTLDKEKCVFCGILQGHVIQCSYPNCCNRYHVTCAIQVGIIKIPKPEDKSNSIFCLEHTSQEDKTKESEMKTSQHIESQRSIGRKRLKKCKRKKLSKVLIKPEEASQPVKPDSEESIIDLVREDFAFQEDKFYKFMEDDMKRVREENGSKLTIKQFIKLKEFVKNNINYLFKEK